MKRFQFFLLFSCVVLFSSGLRAQLITGPDTLCIDKQLQLHTTVTNASTYYWGFCSAYLNHLPTGSSIAAGTGLATPSAITMAKDSSNYFVFVANASVPGTLVRYEFGTNLANVPVATDLGNFAGSLPYSPKGFELVQAGGNWYGFITGGNGVGSDMIRLDFGSSLSNTPVLTDLGALVQDPQDLYFFYEGGRWYAYTNNGVTGNLMLIEFGSSITGTATVYDKGNPGSLALPCGMWPVYDGSNWHIFLVNKTTQRLSRLDFGSSLLNAPVDNDLGNPGGLLSQPCDISIIRDCGSYYGYITNESSNSLTLLTFSGAITNAPVTTDLGNFAGFNQPRYLTRFLRDRDNVFAYTTNFGSNSISRLEYNSCSASSPSMATTKVPPPVTYNAPGLYNVYFAADEGLPTMQVDCKQVQVIPRPIIEVNNDTLICQGDTILLVANGPNLYSNIWDPVYRAKAPYDTTSVYVFPDEDYRYHVHLDFTKGGGCGYDTSVLVKVSRIVADAGPDRFVADGAYTILGGDHLSMGKEYTYVWSPATWLDDPYAAHPKATPHDLQFYVVQVTNDSSGCVRTDTVIVRTECTDIHLPNAFNPVSDIASNRTFGLLNHNIVKLEFFRIYNRWGQAVFDTTDPAKHWDGTFNNIELPPDNYVWIIDGYCDNGKRIKKQGTVLLVK